MASRGAREKKSRVRTSLLLPSPPLVADLDGADGQDDGDDEEEDAADDAGGHRPTFDILGQVVLELLADGVGRGRVREHPEPVGLCGTHVFH